MNNRDVLNYCPNYYHIIDFNIEEDDYISQKLIDIYKKYIFSVNIEDREQLDKIVELDRVLGSYIHDYLFRSTLQTEIVKVRVKNDHNILRSLVDSIIRIFGVYEEYTTRKIYISKWI